MKPLYTEVFTLKISSTQKRTLPIEENFNLGDIHSGFFHKKHKQWQVSEDKTFKNPLIFVKK